MSKRRILSVLDWPDGCENKPDRYAVDVHIDFQSDSKNRAEKVSFQAI